MANNSPVGVAYADPALDSAQFKLYTVATLPAASTAIAGTRAAVSNSNAAYTAGIGATVAAGGSYVVPVFCNGVNWLIG
jgi:hypothetical protein|tara:strand:- start:1777 stop:2013 length:237 start_codon:yes stop_codon:yes gene_type:complete